jgi:sec-independent protein translocase protein TatA
VLEFLEKPGVVIVILLAIVVFGAKRLPDSARALGRSMRILKAEAKGLKDDDAPVTTTTTAAAPAPAPVVETKALPPAATTQAETPAEQSQPHQT